MRLTIIVLSLSLLAVHAAAETTYYQCKDQWNQPVFSERPCGSDAQAGTVAALPHTGSVTPQDNGAMTASRQIRERHQRITYLEDRIDRYEREREHKLRALENSRRHASNNLAGAQYLESLATQAGAVNAEYRAKIDRDEGKIDGYRDDIDRLQAALAQLPSSR